MAGILINIDSDIEKLRRLKAEIEKVKSALKSIDVNIKVDMAADLEAKLKSLTSSYNAIISKVAEAEAKIMESEARIKKFTDSITDAQRKITQTAGMNTGTGTSASDMSAVDNAQTASVDAQAKAYAELEREINGVIGTRYENIKRMIEEENAIRLVKAEIKQLLKYQTDGVPLSKDQSDLLVRLNSSLLTHKAALAEVRQTLSNNVKMDNAAATSMNALSQELSRMRIAYRELTEEERKSPFGKELAASIEQADAKIKGLDASIGNYQRNVGNYKSGFNGLNMSVQQIVRELPSATMGLNMFFLAISNNLPILSDQIKIAKKNYNELIDAQTNGKRMDERAVPVWKELISSLFSWQSAMMVGITLLSMYGKEFTKFVSGLFKTRKEIGLTEEAIKRIADATTSLNAELSKESSEIDKLFGKLAKARKGTGEYDEAKTAILNKYGKYLEGLSDEIRSLNDVAAAYDAVTIAANKSAKARALGRAKEQAENSYSDSIKELASDLIGEFTGANVKGTVTELSEQEAARLTQKIISDLMDNGALSEDSSKSLREIGTIRTDKGTYSGTGAGELNDLIDKTKEYRHELMIANAAFGEFESQFENMSTDELDKALNTLDKIEDILNKSGKGAKFTNKATGLELDITNIRDLFHYREQIQAILNKRNSEVQDVIDGGIVVTGNTADYKRNKQEKTDAERKQKKIEDARLKAEEDLNRMLLDLQKRNQSDEIALMKDGRKKRLAEINADYEARKAEIAAKVAELAELNRKAGITDVDFNGLTIQQGKDIAKANLLNDRNRTASEVDMLLEERRAMDEYLKEYGSFMEKREAITRQYNERITNATTEGERLSLGREKQDALKELDFSEFKKSIDFTDVFGNLGELTSGALSDLKDKLSEYINKAASKLRPEDLKELQDAFAKIEFEEIDRNPFASLASSMDDYRTAQDAVEKAQQELDTVLKGGVVITGQYMDENLKLHNILLTQEQAEKNLAKAQSDRQKSLEKVNATINNIGQKGSAVVNSGQQIVGMLENFGVEVPEVVSTTLDGIGQIMQGLASIDITKPFSLITGSISVITGIGNTIAGWFGAGDSKHEKQIQRLQDQIDALDKSYDRLGKSIEKAYSTDASELIEQQNKMLEQQKILIQQQMEEEEAKKHTDEEKMQEYRDRLEEINELIDDNKEKAIDAIFGEDLQSAIDNFASSYADAWTNGTDKATAARDTVKQMMQQMVQESIKAAIQSSGAMEQIRNKLQQFYADEMLSAWEQESIYKMADDLQKQLDNQFGWADSLFKEDSAEQQSASSRAYGTEMTQEQGAEISGRLTAMTESNIRLESVGQQQFIAITDIKGSMAGIATQLPMIYNVADESRRILADSYLELQSIRENTGAIVKPIKDIKTSITNIERKITNL